MTDFQDKLRSLSFKGSARPAKTTVDMHDAHSVEVTEHWDDRVDVTMRPDTIKVPHDPDPH